MTFDTFAGSVQDTGPASLAVVGGVLLTLAALGRFAALATASG